MIEVGVGAGRWTMHPLLHGELCTSITSMHASADPAQPHRSSDRCHHGMLEITTADGVVWSVDILSGGHLVL
jgi:hypothetical protein